MAEQLSNFSTDRMMSRVLAWADKHNIDSDSALSILLDSNGWGALWGNIQLDQFVNEETNRRYKLEKLLAEESVN